MARSTQNKNQDKKSKASKREELLRKQKKHEQSDSDSDSDNSSDSDYDSECSGDEEMDVHEYRKFLNKIFPSKHMSKKVAEGEKQKKKKKIVVSDSDTESEEEEEEPRKKSKKLKRKSRKDESEDEESQEEESEEEESEDEESEEEESEEEESEEEESEEKRPSKKSNRKSKKYDSEEEEEESDSDEEDKKSSKKSKKYKRKSKKDDSDEETGAINMVFTIGVDGEDDDEYDEEYAEAFGDDEDTEDEDEPVSDCESDSDDESDKKSKGKKSKDKKKGKSKDKKKGKEDTEEKITLTVEEKAKAAKDDAELLVQLKELNDKNGNDTLKECIQLCEKRIKHQKKKQDKMEKKQKDKYARIFKKIARDKNTLNDYTFFEKIDVDKQKKLIKEMREINKITRVEKPYKISLLEADIPTLFKSSAIKKLNTLRHMDPGSGEYYKIKYWVDNFMRIPFGVNKVLPICYEDGVEKCHEFMENAQKTLDAAVYGLNDAKMQIMQMLGQLITNPNSIGTSIAIQGPMGTGKTSIVKEGISKILDRPFAFIALGGATDSSFLEGHSYTYEGSTWGKIVQIIIDSKCMNPVIYFDELDKISDTPKGEEIAGILTHLTDTSQNSQFNDKYFAEIDFDISKCLFIFSYNDESKINPILRDRMYKIQTKGYDRKQKTIISNNYLLPKIREQVKFVSEDIAIPDEVLHYIIEMHCNKEDGVRNLKRCLEIIHTKLNLYRLMKPGTNLFEQDMSLKVEFPFTVTKDIVDKLIKKNTDTNSSYLSLYN